MNKLPGTTPDLTELNTEKVKELFPQAVTEGKIDFGTLKSLLGDEVDDTHEKYQFTWHGKSKAIKLAQSPSTSTLRPSKEDSKDWDTTENLYIEGDNLEVLKQLQKTYFGKIKMIYIDPPYNTGGDFVYKDDFKDTIKNYKEQTNQSHKANAETSGRYHTDWLNMMYPRLMLAKNLLSDDGVIFISIDENELVNLTKLTNEIFGEENYKTQFTIKVRHENRILKGDKDIHETVEFCLLYSKSPNAKINKKRVDNSSIDKYIYEIKISDKPERILKLDNKNVEIFSPKQYTIVKKTVPSEKFLQRISIRGSLKEGNSSGRFYMKNLNGLNNNGYLFKVPNMGNDYLGHRYFQIPESNNIQNGIYFQGIPKDRKEFKEIPHPNFFDLVDEFNGVGYEGDISFRNGKKPLKFIRKLLEISNVLEEKNPTILDFFSGSATTAHAIMKLNAEDGGNRKFIMVQLPELTDEKSEAHKAGYENICEIGKERIRRAGKQIQEEMAKDGKDPSGLDVGFKVFKLDSTNIKEWDSSQTLNEQTLLDFDKIFKDGRNQEDVLYEILLKYGVFNMPVKEIKLNDKTAYDVAEGNTLICLADDINEEDIQTIGRLKPQNVIFKESGFKDDNVKLNAIYTLEKQGVEDIQAI